MYGVVPKPLWERASPADPFNRIQLETNCFVVKRRGDVILLDSGFGAKLSAKQQQHLGVEQPLDLIAGLARIGITRDDVTHVFPSHLHFDHASGLVHGDAESSSPDWEPTFPQAQIFVQQQEYLDSLSERPELAGNYPRDEMLVLERHQRFKPVQGTTEPIPGIRLIPSGGHTAGHQLIYLNAGTETAVYLGDICPTQAHLRTAWTMAYDLFPLDVRKLKPRILGAIAEHEQIALFDHDPHVAAATLSVDERGKFSLREPLISIERVEPA